MLRELLLNIFSLRDIDSHYILIILGIQIRIKHSHTEPEIILAETGVTEVRRDIPVIVSFTSFPKRIKTAAIAAKTLLNQTMKPDRVILWLAEEQFPKKESDLPEDLLSLKQYGLEIEWCEDLKSYKKLIPALKKYPDSIIITVDDDIYYAKDTVETLYNSYLKNPEYIHAHRAARIEIKNKTLDDMPSRILYYKEFSAPNFMNRLTGCAGVLYPPKSLNLEVFNKDFFLKEIPTHDDIWFWANAVLNKTKIKVVKGLKDSIYTNREAQSAALCKVNREFTTKNAYKILLKHYPEIYEILKKEDA